MKLMKMMKGSRPRSILISMLGLILVIVLVFLRLGNGFVSVKGETMDARKVLLSDVQTLTFYHGEMTTGRRSRPVKQLECVSNCWFTGPLPSVVQCRNMGLDDYKVPQWECSGTMKHGYDLGVTTVTCEGFEYPEDPYILQGSCGLEYTVVKVHVPPPTWVTVLFFVFVVICIVFVNSGYDERIFGKRRSSRRTGIIVHHRSRRTRTHTSRGFGGTRRR